MMLAGCAASGERPPLSRQIPDPPASCIGQASTLAEPAEGDDAVAYGGAGRAAALSERRARANCAAAWRAMQRSYGGGG